MTREETITFLKKMSAAYPSYNPGSIQDTVDVWSDTFSDIPYVDVYKSMQNYSQKNGTGFAPSIGQIFAFMKDRGDEES